ncbi:MAG: class I SAM-dependent methyltransferase [Proteobacteria bacterium]|nr:class I SAM-dependent methyltransferase [Pseudomonadota bacterium]MDA1324590.1 class I SAM-dependent methyltransferase [Pseudomonadota bacterium]
MWNDAIDLRDFYRTSLGQIAQRTIRNRIRATWDNVSGLNVLGFGYATPYLLPFRDEAQRVIAAMPAQQGVLHWPADGPGAVTLCDETEIPLPDVSVDRVLMVHGLECSEQLRPMLREIWRVLADGGRLLAVVPNRRGIWARLDRTPFGHGYPYTPGQLNRLLRDTLFQPLRVQSALFVPPSRSRMVIASAPAWENIGARWFPTFSGVLMIEAGKEIYAATPEPTGKRQRRRYAQVVPRANRSLRYP